MLLLLLALLNAFCLGHCTYDVITSIKELSERNKLSWSKITFQALAQNKKERNVILLQVNRHVKHFQAQKQNNAFRQRESKALGDFGIKSRFTSSINLERLLREKRNIGSSQRDLVHTDLAPQIEEPKFLMQNSTILRVFNKRDQLKRRKRKSGYPKVVLPIEKLFADVGVSFQKYLSPDIFHDSKDGNANSLNIELLTADGKKLFATSWIKFDQSNLKLFGFPLKGNQHEHSFILEATNSKGKSATQSITIVVHSLKPLLNHYIHLCTTMTLSEYGGSVERRLRLAKAIANYIFPGLRTENLWIWKFQKGCMYLSFRHLPRKGKCDFDALQTIEEKILDNGEVNSAFQQALKSITSVVSVNLTVQYECRKSNSTTADDELGWLRDIAPIFILLAVVAVPTLISCIVCREVRRRQAAMRQLQDRRMKEDREQMLIQAAEYKHECGLDSESEDEVECTNRPYRLQEEESKKFFGFSRIADIILPEVVIDTMKQGTEIFSTFLPQETRDSAPCDDKIGAARRFTADTMSHSLNKLNLASQEEMEHSIEKPESNLASKVKDVFNFIKSPLDITSLDSNFDSRENSRGAQMKAVEGRKLSKIPAESLLPSISSLFGLNATDVTHGSLREVKENMSTSIRHKLQLIVNAASINRSKENSKGQFDEKMTSLEASGFSDTRIQSSKASQRLIAAPVTYVDFPTSASVLAPIRTRTGGPGERTLLDGKIRKNNTDEEVAEGDVNNIGLLNRMLYQGKNLVNSARKWSASSKDSQDCMQLQKVAKGNWEYDVDYKRKLSLAYNLSTSSEAENSRNRMFASIYDDYGNLFSKYNSSAESRSVENRNTDLPHMSNQASSYLQAVVRNQELLESADRYFVNIVEEQVRNEPSLIEAADGSWRQVESHPGSQEPDGKQTLEKFQPSINAKLNLEKESCFGCSCKAEDYTLRGLKHYDPASGKWYSACNSLKEGTPTEKMSFLKSFKRNEEGSLSQSSFLKSDNLYRSNLRWYKINREPERQVQIARNRHKSSIEIGAVFDQNSSNLYEQSIESELDDESNQIRCIEKREEPKGIWTEDIYDDYIVDSDPCHTSDEETALQALINKMQNESLPHRYVPSEIYFSDSYFDESMQSDRYGEDQAGHLEIACTDPVSKSIGNDFIDITKPHPMHLMYSEEVKYPTQQNQRQLDETVLSPPTDSDKEIIATIDKEYVTEKGSQCDSFEVAEEQAGEEDIKGRGRSLTDGQLQLSMTYLRAVESPTRSEPGYIAKIEDGVKTQKERRRSFLERQRRVEIPEKPNASIDQSAVPTIHVNPIFVSEERMIKDGMEERKLVEDRFDFATIKRMQSINESSSQSSSRMRKHAHSGPFLTANVEAEKFRKQDADIIEHQTKGYFERRRQNMQHLSDKSQLEKPSLEELEPFNVSNRRRTGIRRFSTPSMESWTSTPEKYYYDASGDHSISEDDVNCTGLRKGNEKNPVASGKGRAKEYTQRLLQGVSPNIRRHSTSILGQRCGRNQSGSTLTNTGTFLGRFGEGKLVQTIQTKLGKKDSKAEESKSPIAKEKKRNTEEEEKQLKGSTLTAIRNTLLLLSGGK